MIYVVYDIMIRDIILYIYIYILNDVMVYDTRQSVPLSISLYICLRVRVCVCVCLSVTLFNKYYYIQICISEQVKYPK